MSQTPFSCMAFKAQLLSNLIGWGVEVEVGWTVSVIVIVGIDVESGLEVFTSAVGLTEQAESMKMPITINRIIRFPPFF